MLLNTSRTDLSASELVRASGDVFTIFAERTQDSGNVSYGVDTPSGRFFVKTAGPDTAARSGLNRDARVSLLRNAADLHQTVLHPVLATLHNVAECGDGPALIFEWCGGELLGCPRAERLNPASAFRRFRQLPPDQILRVLDAIIDLHDHLVRKDWIAVDFYDGCLLYDFGSRGLRVVDLDNYHRGAFTNRMGRMFGSTRFMAPEEFEFGATIDERTTVFVLGRTVHELLSDHSARTIGGPELLDIASAACQPDRSARFDSVADFYEAWKQERGVARG